MSGFGFRHEALLYAGEQGFVDGTLPFIRDGVEAGEPTLVVVSSDKIERLRSALNGEADQVRFADMADVGQNPARIIPAWREFVDEHAQPGGRLRGIGEPINTARAGAELVECHRHESLLNFAFADTEGFWLLCPYDTDALDPGVVSEAEHNHPFMLEHGAARDSVSYGGLEAAATPFGESLAPIPADAAGFAFQLDDLPVLRRFVYARAANAVADGGRADDLVLAVNEVAANSIVHGGGSGILHMWEQEDALVCDVRDDGRIESPLAGRQRPAPGQVGGQGLWVANQLCELVQVRCFPAGSAVRLHMRKH